MRGWLPRLQYFSEERPATRWVFVEAPAPQQDRLKDLACCPSQSLFLDTVCDSQQSPSTLGSEETRIYSSFVTRCSASDPGPTTMPTILNFLSFPLSCLTSLIFVSCAVQQVPYIGCTCRTSPLHVKPFYRGPQSKTMEWRLQCNTNTVAIP